MDKSYVEVLQRDYANAVDAYVDALCELWGIDPSECDRRMRCTEPFIKRDSVKVGDLCVLPIDTVRFIVDNGIGFFQYQEMSHSEDLGTEATVGGKKAHLAMVVYDGDASCTVWSCGGKEEGHE